MSDSITYLHRRNIIKQLPKEERDELLKQLIDTDIDLTREEEEFLSTKEMKRYVGKLFARVCHPTAYELSFADDTEKDIFVMQPRRLEILIPIMGSLDDKWREKILTQAVFSNKGLRDDVFLTLNDKDKRFYANLSIVNSDYPTAEVLKYMKPNVQMSLINQLKNRGEALSKEKIDNLSKEAKKYYNKINQERMNIQESVRKYIRKIINEAVSKPGTVFGPFSDEVVLDKKEMKKPQYFSIALNRANKICSNPEKSNEKIDCPINYELQKTFHSTERQFRHIEDTIEDKEIRDVVERGIDTIVKTLLAKGIDVGGRVHLKDSRSNLNVILQIGLDKDFGDETIIKFTIITVMYKQNFISGPDVPTLKV